MRRQERWVVPFWQDGVWRAVTVVAYNAQEARSAAEGVVEADGFDQWPLFDIGAM